MSTFLFFSSVATIVVILNILHLNSPTLLLMLHKQLFVSYISSVEIHMLVKAGSTKGGIDAANMLKASLSRGELNLVGATTFSEYRKSIQKDKVLERRFHPLEVAEPSIKQTVAILEVVSERYAAHHGVRYTKDCLEAAAKLSDRYVTDRFLPDKVC